MTRPSFTAAGSLIVALLVLSPIFVLFLLGWGAELDATADVTRLLINTVGLALATVVGSVLIGVPLAIATAHCRLPFRGIWLAVLVAPLAIPSYIGAFTYFAAFGQGGLLAEAIGEPLFNIEGPLGTALVMTLYTYPLVLLTTRASLRQLDGRMVEAARCLGASLSETLWRVVIPRVRSGIAAGALLAALYSMSDFATPAILGFDTFTRVIYVEYNAFGLDRAALLSLHLLGIIAVVLLLESRVSVDRESGHRAFEMELNTVSRSLLQILMSLVLLASIGLPAWVFGAWLLDEGATGVSLSLIWNTTYPALLAAAVTVVAALPVAMYATRGGAGRWLERISTLGYGVPGIVMGTALLYVGLRLDWFYQTVALLVLGHVLRFLPLAVGPIRNAFGRTDKNLVAAARGLGASPWEAFQRVSLPLLVPAAISGGALVFLEVMRELPLTLLLRPTGLETLTTELWQVFEAGYFGRAAIPGLLLIAISSIGVVLMMRGERQQVSGGAS
ncbi:MAG: iron ABC transporter permease [Pseudomonadota bacterium]